MKGRCIGVNMSCGKVLGSRQESERSRGLKRRARGSSWRKPSETRCRKSRQLLMASSTQSRLLHCITRAKSSLFSALIHKNTNNILQTDCFRAAWCAENKKKEGKEKKSSVIVRIYCHYIRRKWPNIFIPFSNAVRNLLLVIFYNKYINNEEIIYGLSSKYSIKQL